MIGPLPPDPAIYRVLSIVADFLNVRPATVLQWAKTDRLRHRLDTRQPINLDALHRGEASG
jgi:hypothetical protein